MYVCAKTLQIELWISQIKVCPLVVPRKHPESNMGRHLRVLKRKLKKKHMEIGERNSDQNTFHAMSGIRQITLRMRNVLTEIPPEECGPFLFFFLQLIN